jgi:hypothetical protein
VDDEATTASVEALFLLPWGRPRPYFSIGAPRFKRDPLASAIEVGVGKRNPRWVWEEEDGAAEELNTGLGFLPIARSALFISTYNGPLQGPKYNHRLLYAAQTRW